MAPLTLSVGQMGVLRLSDLYTTTELTRMVNKNSELLSTTIECTVTAVPIMQPYSLLAQIIQVYCACFGFYFQFTLLVTF